MTRTRHRSEKPEKLRQRIRAAGWVFVRQEGSHEHYERNGVTAKFNRPSRSTDIGGGMLDEIYKQFGLDEEAEKVSKKKGVPIHRGVAPPEGTLGRRIWDSRWAASLTLREIGEALDLQVRDPVKELSRWERGERTPSHGNILKLATFFDWSDILAEHSRQLEAARNSLPAKAPDSPAPDSPAKTPEKPQEAPQPQPSVPVAIEGLTASQVIEWVMTADRALAFYRQLGMTPEQLDEVFEKARLYDEMMEVAARAKRRT